MKRVPLTNGGFTLVDDEDYERVSQYRWQKALGKGEEQWFVKRWSPTGTIMLSRLLTDCPKGMQVDHINWNGLDNRKENLRIVSQIQNKQNMRGAMSNNRLGIRGVCLDKKSGKYRAYCYLDKKHYNFGFFETPEEAEQAAVEGRQTVMTHSQN